MTNHKRTERIYGEEGLALRRKRQRKGAAGTRVIIPLPQRTNEKWSIYFVIDSFITGQRFWALAIVDDFSREYQAIEVDTSLGGRRVVGVLERLSKVRRLPEVITIDNGPEFASRALGEWVTGKGAELNFIRHGKPVENAFAESFINRLRDECLNTNWFISLVYTSQVIEECRRDYNNVRPHNSLKGVSPNRYAVIIAGL